MKIKAEIKPVKLTATMRLKLALLWLAALIAPGVAVPAAKRVRDSAPVDITVAEFRYQPRKLP